MIQAGTENTNEKSRNKKRICGEEDSMESMNIKEAEEETGITRQNIRFYEKKGLIRPKRNQENDYRQYSEEDIQKLKTIKMLRKLDFPVEDIREVMEGNVDFLQAVRNHLDSMKERKKELSVQISFLERMEREGADLSSQDRYLRQMEQEEQKGRRFTDILEDYKRTIREESRRRFSFVPETMARTPREFTEELIHFANQEKINLVITKEGMNPLFEIDGVQYEAFRLSGRFGIVIQCQMTDSGIASAEQKDEQRKSSIGRRAMRLFHYSWPVLIWAALFFSRAGISLWSILAFIGTLGVFGCGCFTYWNLKN